MNPTKTSKLENLRTQIIGRVLQKVRLSRTPKESAASSDFQESDFPSMKNDKQTFTGFVPKKLPFKQRLPTPKVNQGTPPLVFDDIPVSTKTIVIMLNVTLDIEKIFDMLPVTNYIVVPKKRGRKKKSDDGDPNSDVPVGSIITIEYEKKIRGVSLTKKKSSGGRAYFRNSITVVMLLESKRINFKISRNGVIQMTGCKFDKQAEDCVRFIWHYISGTPSLYSFKQMEDSTLKAIFVPAMRNIDFNLGFLINREILDEYINVNTSHLSIFEANFGYTGVNIKVTVPTAMTQLTQIEYIATPLRELKTQIPYEIYLDMLSPKDKQKKLKKKKVVSFMVFHSGKTIMSGCSAELMRDSYYAFLELIKSCRSEIEEKLR